MGSCFLLEKAKKLSCLRVKVLPAKRFGQDICHVVLRGYLLNFDQAEGDVLSDEVDQHEEMFRSHEDSRGHTGYCICIGDMGSFYAKSTKQQLVATSSTHAEVKALYQLIVDLIFIINICDEIQRSIDLTSVLTLQTTLVSDIKIQTIDYSTVRQHTEVQT